MAAPALAKRAKVRDLKKFSATELRMKIAEIKSKLGTGMSDIQVAEEMGLPTKDYNALKRELYQQDKLEMSSKNSEEVFIDYRMRQEGCIKDLEKMIQTFSTTKQYNAMVGAVKAKSDIIDRIVARGQEFGVLEKVPEKKQIIAGVLVAGMTNDDLRARVAKEAIGMSEAFKKYGEGDILSLPAPKTAAAAAILPKKPSATTVEAEAVKPAFTAGLRPKEAVAGISKVAGGKATAAAKAAKVSAPPFSLTE